MAKAKKPTSKKESKTSGSSSPLIDTNLAAENAAKLIASRVSSGPATNNSTKQSAGFKQLKEGLSKPHLAGMNSMLNQGGTVAEGKKMGGAVAKQIGHNQTYGSDSSRVSVPRRTAG